MRSFNAVVLGAGGVGKSALTIRFMRDLFVDQYDPTIEEAYRKSVSIDGELCLLEVLDTAGIEQFTAINELYIKRSAGFILVFSLTAATSMREVENLRNLIYRIKNITLPNPSPGASALHRSQRSSGATDVDFGSSRHEKKKRGQVSQSVPLVIVGTKCDLVAERQVPRDLVVSLAMLWGVPYYETSSKRGTNVDNVFQDIVRQMRNDADEHEVPNRKPKKKKLCVVM